MALYTRVNGSIDPIGTIAVSIRVEPTPRDGKHVLPGAGVQISRPRLAARRRADPRAQLLERAFDGTGLRLVDAHRLGSPRVLDGALDQAFVRTLLSTGAATFDVSTVGGYAATAADGTRSPGP